MTERLQALADLKPILESVDADFGHWEAPPPVDGVHRMPGLLTRIAQRAAALLAAADGR